MLKILFINFMFSFSYGLANQEFRFDYKFSEKADGWLKLHIVPATWQDAKLRCHAEGAVLASPLTNELQAAILEHVRKEKGDEPYSIFTGIHATYSKGDYTSVEGLPLLHMHLKWASGEPDNVNNSENCLVMLPHSAGAMGDAMCSDVFPYVCYKKNINISITECGTHDKGYNYESRTGSCYKFHRHGLTWEGAYMTCMAEGGHMIVINSDVEAKVLMELYAQNPDNTLFTQQPYLSIGMRLLPGDGSWMTIHGEYPSEAGYDRWQPGEPNNGSQPIGEFCVVTHRNNGMFYDAPCYWHLPFICEKKPRSLEDSVVHLLHT